MLFTDEFEAWWACLTAGEQVSVDTVVQLLETNGVTLRFPHTSGVSGSKYGHLRELRIQHQGRPLRVLYAFDPERQAVLLIGGDKTGQDRWYEIFVPLADSIYQRYLEQQE